MMRIVCVSMLAVVIVALGVSGVSAQTLDIGDTAPALSISEWVKGSPVSLAKDSASKVHVIEFWATWCPPCKMSVPLLTDLQNKYRKHVVIVGVTEPDARGNSPSAIRRFTKDQGDKMNYSVAIDDGRTSREYLMAAGAMGIPHAFVINKQRKIVWQGSPLDPALDSVLAGVIAGTYDLQTAMRERKINKKLEELQFRMQLGQWSAVWDGLLDILKMDPANETAIYTLQGISLQELNNTQAFEKWVRSHVAAHREDTLAMQRVAEMLCSIDDLSRRMPSLALDAARAAYDAKPTRNAWTLATYARALYQVGRIDRAIVLQQDAVVLAGETDRTTIRGVLDFYRTCRELQRGGD